MHEKKFKTVDEYLSALPDDVRNSLESIRCAVKSIAPDAEEVISYNMPAFRQYGILVYYAAFRDHIGFFPTSSGVTAFRKELAGYDTSKGTIRFPLETPIPLSLVKRIVKFRLVENKQRQQKKQKP